MPENNEHDGFILVNKDTGKTSFETVSILRKTLNIKKAGHAGTLDKNASGLLIIAAGRSTKLLKYLLKQSKKYTAEIYFGIQTNTDDANGVEINKFSGEIIKDNILKVIPDYIGVIDQTPPLFSAVHINGERSYKLALKNKEVTPPVKQVEIKSIDIISFDSPILKISVDCSSGTYIRSLARDIGMKTGYYGYLYSLVRDSISNFQLTESFSLDEIKKNNYKVIPPLEILSMLPELLIKEESLNKIKNGLPISGEWFLEKNKINDGTYKVKFNNNLIAVIIKNNGKFSYDLVYN